MGGVILVGNGSTATAGNFGEVIDAFETVVRFSWFWIKGHEQQVGTRTDVWATTIFCRKRLAENSFRRVVAHSWEWNCDKCKTFRLLKQAFPAVEKTSRETVDEMSDFAGLPKRYAFSTGAIVAWLFLRDFPVVTLSGFDWATGNTAGKHHYGDKQTRGTIHRPELEFLFFDKLKGLGKLEHLEQ